MGKSCRSKEDILAWSKKNQYVHYKPQQKISEITSLFDPIKGNGAVTTELGSPLKKEDAESLRQEMKNEGIHQIFRAGMDDFLKCSFGNLNLLENINIYLNKVSDLFSQIEGIEMSSGHWGIRTEDSRKILEEDGHKHGENTYASVTISLIGPGTWFFNKDKEKQISLPYETVFITDGARAIRIANDLNFANVHGTPDWPHERLIFFCGPEPKLKY
ncbi:MAG: hypothetical protein K9K67_05810 [Bacteriovoracaceae bacterium]|nr:hypothetical protein [Bacteriovoracaceae bacterium]